MKIAIPYEDGKVFQHFGHAESFKIYETAEKKIVSSNVISTGDTGHEALAKLLSDAGVTALICGGIGDGAIAALTNAGIVTFSGVSGDADEAVKRFLNGEIKEAGANCDHHDEEMGGGCGGNCGSCGGCGGAPAIEGKNVGKSCKVHYRGTFNDGTLFDSSYDRGEPLAFVCGVGQMIRGFDAAVANMEAGEKVNIHLMPEEAYGEADPRAIFTLDVSQLPGSEDLKEGERVYLSNSYGQPFPATVTKREGTSITFDANHEMAGKELNFEIELVEVQ